VVNRYSKQSLGMRVDHIGPGEADLSMVIHRFMLNGHASHNGGYIFTLAEQRICICLQQMTTSLPLAQQNQIFLLSAPGKPDESTAGTSAGKQIKNRTLRRFNDVTVQGEDGRTIALFRGLSAPSKASFRGGNEPHGKTFTPARSSLDPIELASRDRISAPTAGAAEEITAPRLMRTSPFTGQSLGNQAGRTPRPTYTACRICKSFPFTVKTRSTR